MIAKKEQKVYASHNFCPTNENYATIHIGFLTFWEDFDNED